MTMSISAWGDPGGPAVILLHALGCHRGWWDWVAPLLAGHYHVVAPDFRGHGDTRWQSDYSFAAYAEDLKQLIVSLGEVPYALVGHSMGGYVALTVGASPTGIAPDAMVVVDMKTSASEQELTDLKLAAGRPARSYPTLDEAVGRYRLSPPEHAVPADRLRTVAAQCFRQQPDGSWTEKFDRKALAIDSLDPGALLQKITCPTLFVRGEKSLVMPKEPAESLARAAGSTLVEAEGLFHHLPLENPDWLAEVIIRHLRATKEPFR